MESDKLQERLQKLEARVRELESGYTLRDAQRRTRLRLALSEEGNPLLALFDEDQRPCAILGFTEEPFLRLYGADSRCKIEIAVENGNPIFAIGPAADDRRLMFSLIDEGGLHLFMWDQSGELRLDLSLAEDGVGINFLDELGRTRFAAGCRGGVGGAVVVDEKGIPKAALQGD